MAGTFTTAFPNSFKVELPQGLHNFTATTGGAFKCALGKALASLSQNYDATTTNYSTLTGGSDEASATGYSAGGYAFTAAKNLTPLNTTTQTYWQWDSSANPTWTVSTTLSTGGCLIYNTSASNRCVYVGSFGGTQTLASGTLTLVQPGNAAGTSLLQIN